MIYDVHVIRKDIEEGRACSCKLCPIALAVGRVLDLNFQDVWVGTYTIRTKQNPRIKIIESENADFKTTDFIRWFDHSMGMDPRCKPFSFKIEVLDAPA